MKSKLLRVIPGILVLGMILGSCKHDPKGPGPFIYPARYQAVPAWVEQGENTIEVAASVAPVSPVFRAAEEGNLKYLPVIYAEQKKDKNYFVILLGHIDNVPIVSGTRRLYSTGSAPVTINREQSQPSHNTVIESVRRAFNETTINTAAKILNRTYYNFLNGTGSMYLDTRRMSEIRQTMGERSVENTLTTAQSYAEGNSDMDSYTVGNNDEPAGAYRISLFATTDVYYLAEFNADNTELLNEEIYVCAREESYTYQLDYDPGNNGFNKSEDGDMLTVPDPDSFSLLPVPEIRFWFAAVGNSGRAAYSDDGMNWRASSLSSSPSNWSGIAFGKEVDSDDGLFIAVAPADGVVQGNTLNHNYNIVYTNDRFGSSASTTIGTRSVTITPSSPGIITNLEGITYADGIEGGTWVAVGTQLTINRVGTTFNYSSSGRIFTTSNRFTNSDWTPFSVGGDSPGEVKIWKDVTYGNKLVAVGASGKMAYSTDASNWTPITVGTNNWNKVSFGNGLFVAVGDSGSMAWSADGIAWAQIPGNDINWNSVHCGGGRFVAVGSAVSGYSAMAYSDDGKTWAIDENAEVTNTNWNDITYANGVWAAVGGINSGNNMGRMAYSTDGINWTAENFGGAGYWRAVTVGY